MLTVSAEMPGQTVISIEKLLQVMFPWPLCLIKLSPVTVARFVDVSTLPINSRE